MANIRANCPTCGKVDMSAEAISLEVAGDADEGHYAFRCPDCGAEVVKPADRKVVALLRSAGVGTNGAPGAPLQEEPPSLPLEDRNPRPDAPAFTLDDLIDLHFLLEDHAWLAEELSAAGAGEH
jgi:predicted RNA-binding Zn-ribbon protein involved in translation (DUF1610 family)